MKIQSFQNGTYVDLFLNFFIYSTNLLAVLSSDQSLPPGIYDSVISNKDMTLLSYEQYFAYTDVFELFILSEIPGGRDIADRSSDKTAF